MALSKLNREIKMSSAISQICVSAIRDGHVNFFALDFKNQHIDLDTLFTHISLPQDKATALALVSDAMNTKKFEEICARLMVMKVAEPTTIVHGFEGELDSFNEYCKSKLTSKLVILHINAFGDWYFAAKNEELDTNGLIPFVDALQSLYTNQNLPDDLIETLFENEGFPLRVYEIEEYSDDEKLEYHIEPLYSDAPAHVYFENNYVTELEHEED